MQRPRRPTSPGEAAAAGSSRRASRWPGMGRTRLARGGRARRRRFRSCWTGTSRARTTTSRPSRGCTACASRRGTSPRRGTTTWSCAGENPDTVERMLRAVVRMLRAVVWM
eukprot:8114810-Pyramimonas_sp.AAC.1